MSDPDPFDYMERVRGLINAGFDVNDTNNENQEPLILTAVNGNLPDLVEFLIGAGANVDVCGEGKLTVLHHAAHEGWLSVARAAVEKGINVNAIAENGKTPLILAAECGNLDIVKLLVSAGADLNYCYIGNDLNIISLVDCIFSMGMQQMERIGVICGSDKGRTALFAAVEKGNTEIVKFLPGSGANVNCCRYTDYTPLHEASAYGYLEIAKALVESQANINARCDDGFTPLYVACSSDSKEIVEYLVNAGADLKAEVEGESPLTYLIKAFDDVDLVKLFIKRGASITSKEYELMLEKPFLKESILQDIKVCTEIIIDNFNNKDLPKFCELVNYGCNLPKLDKLTIGAGSKVAEDVLQAVEHNIQANGHCKILELHPIVLSMISVRSFIDYCHHL